MLVWRTKKLHRKEEGKDQESIQSNTTPRPDPGHHMGKWQKHKKHNIKEIQEASPFPAGDEKASRNKQDSMADTYKSQITKKKDPQMKHHLGTVSKKILEGLNMFDGTTRVGSDISYFYKQIEKILIRQLLQELPDLGLLCLQKD